MRNSVISITAAAALLACPALGKADGKKAASVEKGQKFRLRDIVRAGIDNRGRVHGDLARITGLANAISVKYTVLLLNDDGTEQKVNEEKTSFSFGQKFRLLIEADTDVYLYVFHEGPNGDRDVLMPDAVDKGRVPFVKKDESKVIPDDGTWFEFVPPAGRDVLLIYATKTKIEGLTPDAAFKRSDLQKKRIEFHDKPGQAFRKSDDRKADPKQVAQGDRPTIRFSFRGIGEGISFAKEAERQNRQEGKTVIHGVEQERQAPGMFVEVVLRTDGRRK